LHIEDTLIPLAIERSIEDEQGVELTSVMGVEPGILARCHDEEINEHFDAIGVLDCLNLCRGLITHAHSLMLQVE